jgi:mannosyl-oligosaccharide alpha-1,2-mannosidase
VSYKLVGPGSVHLISAAGLPAQGINPSTGQPVGGYIGCIFDGSVYDPTYRLSQTWGGGSDSYFEYLIKYARLSNTDDNRFADTWLTAVDSSITHLKRVSLVHHRFPTLTGGCVD